MVFFEQNIYNFDEPGFQKGCSPYRKGHYCIPSSYRPKYELYNQGIANRSFSLNASMPLNDLSPTNIFSGKVHQSQLYQVIYPDWLIGLSDNGSYYFYSNGSGLYNSMEVRLGNRYFISSTALIFSNRPTSLSQSILIGTSSYPITLDTTQESALKLPFQNV
jgi:hypothetical protein